MNIGEIMTIVTGRIKKWEKQQGSDGMNVILESGKLLFVPPDKIWLQEKFPEGKAVEITHNTGTVKFMKGAGEDAPAQPPAEPQRPPTDKTPQDVFYGDYDGVKAGKIILKGEGTEVREIPMDTGLIKFMASPENKIKKGDNIRVGCNSDPKGDPIAILVGPGLKIETPAATPPTTPPIEQPPKKTESGKKSGVIKGQETPADLEKKLHDNGFKTAADLKKEQDAAKAASPPPADRTPPQTPPPSNKTPPPGASNPPVGEKTNTPPSGEKNADKPIQGLESLEARVAKVMSTMPPIEKNQSRIALQSSLNTALEIRSQSFHPQAGVENTEREIKEQALRLFLWTDSMTSQLFVGR